MSPKTLWLTGIQTLWYIFHWAFQVPWVTLKFPSLPVDRLKYPSWAHAQPLLGSSAQGSLPIAHTPSMTNPRAPTPSLVPLEAGSFIAISSPSPASLYQHPLAGEPQSGSSAASASRAAAGPPQRCPPGRLWAGASSQETRCPAAHGTHHHQLQGGYREKRYHLRSHEPKKDHRPPGATCSGETEVLGEQKRLKCRQ